MLNSQFFINKFSYLVLLIPLLLLTGPFLPDFILSVTCIFFILLTIKEKKIHYFNNNFVKFFLLFWITLVISSLISENLINSLRSSFFYFRFGLIVIILNYLLIVSQRVYSDTGTVSQLMTSCNYSVCEALL